MLSLNGDSVILNCIFLWNQPRCSFSHTVAHCHLNHGSHLAGYSPLCLVERTKKKPRQKEAEVTHPCCGLSPLLPSWVKVTHPCCGLSPPSLSPPCAQEERPERALCRADSRLSTVNTSAPCRTLPRGAIPAPRWARMGPGRLPRP